MATVKIDKMLDKLVAIMPPPHDAAGSHGDCAAAERLLHTALPDDYKTFVTTYGAGHIGEFMTAL